MEEEQDDQDHLWDDLAYFGETEAEREPTVPAQVDVQAPLPLGDRLVELYLNGLLPVLLMGLAAAALTGQSDLRFMGLGLVLAFVFAWPLARLVRTYDGVSATKLLLYVFPILFLNCLMGFASVCGYHSFQGNPLHLEQLAWSFQGVLESCLNWSLPWYLGYCGFLAALVPWAKRSYPWLDSPAFDSRVRRWSTYPAILFGLLFVLGVGWKLTPAAEVVEWREQAAQGLKARFLGDLPLDGPARVWTERSRERERLVTEQSGDKNYSTPEHRKRALANLKPVLDFESELPTSQRELRAAINYLGGLDEAPGHPEVAKLQMMRLSLMTVPRSGATPDLEYFLLPLLARSQQREEGLQRLEQELKAMRESENLVLPSMEALDLGAYWVLWKLPDALYRPGSMGWDSQSQWRKFRTHGIEWVYNGHPAPRDLRILGFTTSWSPTRMALWMNRWRLSREWLQTREQIRELEPDKRKALIRAKGKDVIGAAKPFWSRLQSYASDRQTQKMLEVGVLIVRLKLAKVRTGKFPDTLDSLVADLEAREEFSWEPKEKKLTVRAGGPWPVVLTLTGGQS